MINYNSDGDRIFSSSDDREDNIDRIQAKLQSASIGQFAKFIDFVNNEFKTVYKQFDELNQECVEFEERTRLTHLSIVKSHNQLIDTLTEYQISFHAIDKQHLQNLVNCKIDLAGLEVDE